MRVVAIVAAALIAQATAVNIYIGDVDGFGYDASDPVLLNSNGVQIDFNPTNGLLNPGELLPDLNGDGVLAIGSGDTFDNRDAGEIADFFAQHTDKSIEGSGAADGLSFLFSLGGPGVYPDHKLTLAIADYDVSPVTILADGAVVPGLALQNNANEDGLIQLIEFNIPSASLVDGFLVVSLNAPNEPYLAIDFLSLTEASLNPENPCTDFTADSCGTFIATDGNIDGGAYIRNAFDNQWAPKSFIDGTFEHCALAFNPAKMIVEAEVEDNIFISYSCASVVPVGAYRTEGRFCTGTLTQNGVVIDITGVGEGMVDGNAEFVCDSKYGISADYKCVGWIEWEDDIGGEVHGDIVIHPSC